MRQLGLNEPGEELDPSVNPSLERRWAHQAFRNGEHGGKSVLDLKEKLRQGIMDIPSLVAVFTITVKAPSPHLSKGAHIQRHIKWFFVRSRLVEWPSSMPGNTCRQMLPSLPLPCRGMDWPSNMLRNT